MNAESRTSSGGPPPAPRGALRGPLGWGAALAVVASVCALFAWSNRQYPQPANAAPAPAAPVSFDQAVEAMKVASTAPRPDAVPAAAASPDVRNRAQGLLARTDRLLRDYARQFGEFPIGANADITRALAGDNPKRIIFVTLDELPMNPAGELIDAWGTPYFFHQVSGTQMEIFSAGPDRQMWSRDDLKLIAN
jgi:hypothetical protein